MPASEVGEYMEYLDLYSEELKKLNLTTEIKKSNFNIDTFTEITISTI